MSASDTHERLVESIVFCLTEIGIDTSCSSVQADLIGSSRYSKPPKLKTFIPDVFAQELPTGKVVVGEAKTPWDIDNRHTYTQIEAFMSFCSEGPDRILVLAVPWFVRDRMINLVADIQIRNHIENIHTIFLDMLGC